MYRPGQWIIYNTAVGVVFSATDTFVVMHAVAENGETLYEMLLPVAYVRLATPDEIPLARQPGPPIRPLTWSERVWRFLFLR